MERYKLKAGDLNSHQPI